MADFNNGDRSLLVAEKVNSNLLGLALTPDGGSRAATSGRGTQSLPIDETEWIVGVSGTLDFDAAAIATAVKEEVTDAIQAAKIVFTVDWSEAENAPVEPEYVDFTVTSTNRVKVGYTGATGENLVIPATFQDEDGTLYKVTSIGDSAFYNCTSLTSITIPDSVTSIESGAFYSCPNLTDVYYTGTKEQWSAITIGNNNTPLTLATIHYNS